MREEGRARDATYDEDWRSGVDPWEVSKDV